MSRVVRWCRRLATLVGTIVFLSLPGASPARATCVANVALDDVLNMRSGPGPGFRVIHSLAPGSCGVAIVGPCQGKWCRISARGRRGWVNTRFLSDDGGDDGIGGGNTADRLGNTAWCVAVPAGDVLNVRKHPDARALIVGIMRNGFCNVRGTGRCQGIWCEIATDEFTGWINTRFVEPE